MALIEVYYEERISIERITILVQGWYGILDLGIGVESRHLKIKSNWHKAIEPYVHHHNHVSSGNPRDSKEYSEHEPNLYDPRDGGVMQMENKSVLTVEDAHSEYGSVGFNEREDSNHWNERSTKPQSTTRAIL
ncbi:hypothetical protein H5410_031023 [Solanum commersonii]|uniref:Uncharacterized protein n=1 Tax=Solanum commersonii TaxID=4109 RepID=A0A9J5YHX6_SOLCO|nr:hypothetical protein H5410_031023 [Solanum commersonii]